MNKRICADKTVAKVSRVGPFRLGSEVEDSLYKKRFSEGKPNICESRQDASEKMPPLDRWIGATTSYPGMKKLVRELAKSKRLDIPR
ncbi:hypothetical protein E4U40_007632 [Claviceps sp. LM458 group G5]|nr:hypothetical protein E4U40_007632 [Claviceps sp. LM458 group G5]